MSERLQQSGKALGSDVLLTILADDASDGYRMLKELWDFIIAFENRFSRFIPMSELSQLNESAGGVFTASNELRDIVLLCKRMHINTQGLFDPCVLPSLQRAGYLGSWPEYTLKHDAIDYRERIAQVSVAKVGVHGNEITLPNDSAIDLGGIGKGYLLDKLTGLLDKKGQSNYWLSLGGDIVCSGHDLDGSPWDIMISAADNVDKSVETISATQQRMLAIATSGITKRQGGNGLHAWHHLIDPRTGLPAETQVLTATVCATTATEADVYAKCLVIGGLSETESSARYSGLSRVILQFTDGTVLSRSNKGKTE